MGCTKIPQINGSITIPPLYPTTSLCINKGPPPRQPQHKRHKPQASQNRSHPTTRAKNRENLSTTTKCALCSTVHLGANGLRITESRNARIGTPATSARQISTTRQIVQNVQLGDFRKVT